MEFDNFEFNDVDTSLTKLQVVKLGLIKAMIAKANAAKENIEYKEYADEAYNLQFIAEKVFPLLLEASEMNESGVPEKVLNEFIKRANSIISIVDFADLNGDEVISNNDNNKVSKNVIKDDDEW